MRHALLICYGVVDACTASYPINLRRRSPRNGRDPLSATACLSPLLAQSFLPLTNPLGMGTADLIELGLAALLLVSALRLAPVLEPLAARLAQKRLWSILLLAALPVVVAARPATAPSRPRPRHLRRIQPSPRGRYSAPFSPGQPDSSRSIGSSRRSSSCSSPPTAPSIPVGQGLMLAFGWIDFRHALGRRNPRDGCAVRALLLDAARLDHARLGAHRRPARRAWNSGRSISG